jgi:uncharacterized iron-regulated protein
MLPFVNARRAAVPHLMLRRSRPGGEAIVVSGTIAGRQAPAVMQRTVIAKCARRGNHPDDGQGITRLLRHSVPRNDSGASDGILLMKVLKVFRGIPLTAESRYPLSSGPGGARGRPVSAARASLLPAVLLALSVAGCAVPAHHPPVVSPHTRHDKSAQPAAALAPAPVSATPVLEPGAMPDLAGIIPRLAEKRVVYVGETHDQLAHHLTQLEIIRRLHKLHPRLAIGMEQFQQPFQHVLDDYIAGKLSEREMLRKSEYFRRWRIDYRLYAPILRYAREQQLPVVALNLPVELTDKVAHEGMAALSAAEQAQLPTGIDRSNKTYVQRLRKIYDRHPHNGASFERFLDVQLLWDEGMAQRAAGWLAAHPDYHMVVLAGSGHLAWGSGIPDRLQRRLPVRSAIVLNDWNGDLDPGVADFILLTTPRTLPPGGRIGIFLQDDKKLPTVENCIPDSPCVHAGLKRGDRLLSIDGEPVNNLTDLRLALWDKRPGDSVTLRIRRKHWFSAPQELSYSIKLR